MPRELGIQRGTRTNRGNEQASTKVDRMSGRPTKLTPQVRSEILHEIAAGTPKRFAAQSAGITERSLYNYLRRGAEDSRIQGKKKSVFAEFFQSFQKAEAVGVADLRRQLMESPAGVWQKFAWMLERQYPADFGAASARKVIEAGYSQVDTPLDRLVESLSQVREDMGVEDPDRVEVEE